jgi:TFIIF-interacting CTD phosphatase-like protein
MDIYKNCSFLFISDDIEFVKQNYPNSYYSIFNDEMIDLILMSLCDHNIIANSTFSWWSAWLNKNNNKTVVGPKKWFSDQSDIDSKNIIPKSWIQI